MPSAPDHHRRSFLIFYLLALGITWPFWISVAASSQHLLPFRLPLALVPVGAFGPSLAAIALAAADGGQAGVRELLRGLLRWRVGLRWYLVALLLPAAVSLLAIGLYVVLGGAVPRFSLSVAWYSLPLYFLAVLLFVGPLQEEIGWRGYALPALEAGRGTLPAALILGPPWALWHLPLFWMDGIGKSELPFAPFALAIVALSILFAWVYDGTGGSLLLCLIFHASLNFSLEIVPVLPEGGVPFGPSLIGIGLLWAVAVVVGSLRLAGKPPPRSG
jgi:membrane protease YdiL (CAAX protease family)